MLSFSPYQHVIQVIFMIFPWYINDLHDLNDIHMTFSRLFVICICRAHNLAKTKQIWRRIWKKSDSAESVELAFYDSDPTEGGGQRFSIYITELNMFPDFFWSDIYIPVNHFFLHNRLYHCQEPQVSFVRVVLTIGEPLEQVLNTDKKYF